MTTLRAVVALDNHLGHGERLVDAPQLRAIILRAERFHRSCRKLGLVADRSARPIPQRLAVAPRVRAEPVAFAHAVASSMAKRLRFSSEPP